MSAPSKLELERFVSTFPYSSEAFLVDNRIHRADFRSLVTIGPPLRLHSKETKAREGPKRVVLRFEFRFWQEERLVYVGDQSAIFVKGRAFEGD